MDAIQAICFDLDETLWPSKAVLQAAENALYAWLGQHYPRITAHYSQAELRERRHALGRREPHLQADLTQLRQRCLQELAEEFGYPARLAQDGFAVFINIRNRVQPFADVPPALARLGQHFRLCTLTNGNADVRQTRIGDAFELCFSSIQAGVAKPHPDVFHQLCAELQLAPQQILHIGDDSRNDVLGPQAIGMPSLWLNRSGQSWPETAPPPVTVKDLYGVLEWLGVG